MASEKQHSPTQPPPLLTTVSSSIIDDAKRLIETSREVQHQIAASLRPDEATFTNAVLPLVQAENALHLQSHILSFYQHVSPDEKLRDASAEAEKRFN